MCLSDLYLVLKYASLFYYRLYIWFYKTAPSVSTVSNKIVPRRSNVKFDVVFQLSAARWLCYKYYETRLIKITIS